MNFEMAPLPRRKTAVCSAGLLMLATLAGCGSMDPNASSERLEYRTQAAKTAPLEVPPDLSQLQRDGRYQPQVGVVVSASGLNKQGAAAATTSPSAPAVALNKAGDVQLQRAGDVRWLVTTQTPEQVYPQVKAFWAERGLTLTQDEPALGLLQTDWAENRAKLPNDFIRNSIGKLFGNLMSTGERDLYRTRIERGANGGSEIYISHQGVVEVVAGENKESTRWQVRPADPLLEAEMLSRLMLKLGGVVDLAQARETVAKAPDAAPRARAVDANSPATMEIDEGFDRAWRQVGLALDRSGFTIEDRDRSAGLYFVRYQDPALVGQEEPNFFQRLFSSTPDANRKVQRYRVVLKAAAGKTAVRIQNADGLPDEGPAARHIVARLIDVLR